MHSLVKHTMSQVSVKSIRWVFDCSEWTTTSLEWFKCLKSIQPEERDRINRFVFCNDAMSSMAGRLLMRRFLVETTSSPWKTLRIARSEKGKPYVSGLDHVVFSVSHHGRLTVLAGEIFEQEKIVCVNKDIGFISEHEKSRLDVCTDDNNLKISNQDVLDLSNSIANQSLSNSVKTEPMSETSDVWGKSNIDPGIKTITNRRDESKTGTLSTNVLHTSTMSKNMASAKSLPSLGIDICNQELPRNTPIPEFFRLMRRNFHEHEWRYILAPHKESSQLGRFYRLWSLKEAFVKATGTGISVPLNEICFRIASEVGEENDKNTRDDISTNSPERRQSKNTENCAKEVDTENSQKLDFVNSPERDQKENPESKAETPDPQPQNVSGKPRKVSGNIRSTCVTDTRVVLHGQIREDWKFEETLLMDKYCVAVALHEATPGTVPEGYEVVTLGDLQGCMEDLGGTEEEEEEIYYQAQDFVKKQLRPWD